MDIKQKYLNQIVDEINMMIAVISKDNTLISANKALLDFAGVKLEDIVGIAYWDLPWWQHSADLQNKLLFAINDSYMGQSSRFNATHFDAKGELHEIDFIIKPVMMDDEPEYFLAMGYNITDLVSAQKELTQRDRRLKAFFDYSIEGYFFLSLPDQVSKDLVDDNMIKIIVEQFRLEGVNQRLSEIVGSSVIDIQSIFSMIGIDKNLEAIIHETIKEGSISLQTQIEVHDEKRFLNIILVAIYDEQDCYEGNFAIVRDITAEVKNLEDIKYLAHKDYLTGINNRRNFFTLGEALYIKQKEEAGVLSVAMLDIDHFKKVNDTYGHGAGDVVIRETAQIISEYTCNMCVLGRYGGEEYVAVLPHDVDTAFKTFETIREQLRNHKFIYKDLEIQVTVSIGLVYVDFKIDSLESAITKADKALYESKENGRNQSTVFIESIHGDAAIDKMTGLFNEKSMRFKLSKVLHDAKQTGDTLWLLYYKIDIIKEAPFLTEERHFKTMGLCISRAVRDRDFIGRIGENGFLVVMRQVSSKRIEEVYMRGKTLLELGFNGMLDQVVTLKGCTYNAASNTDVDEIFKILDRNLKIIR